MNDDGTSEPFSPTPLFSEAETPLSEPGAAVEPAPPAPRKRGWPVTAWVVILLLTAFVTLHQMLRKESAGGVAQENEMGLVLVQMQARYLVGLASFPMGRGEAALYEQAKAYNTGPLPQRLRFIALAGELAGPEEALRQLDELDRKVAEHGVKPTQDQRAVGAALRRLYGDYTRLRPDAPSVGPSERQLLRTQLGWFGELALAPAGIPPTWQAALALGGPPVVATPAAASDPVLPAVAVAAQRYADTHRPEARKPVLAPAERTFLTLVGTAIFAVLVGLGGFIGLIVLAILWFTGNLRGGLGCGSLHGGVYAETFAVWLLLFGALNWGSGYLPLEVPRLPAAGLTMLLSLLALAWPVVRGIPWRQVRAEIGWTAGRQPVVEPLAGAAWYAMALPMLTLGALLMLVLMLVQRSLAGEGPPGDNFGPTAGASHPIIVMVAGSDWWVRLQVFVLAAVIAPIVEETMFRGVLYRHLREATCGVRAVWSVLLSATVVSFLFAVIHPQGLVAVPALMALAYAFCLAREWRGSLIAPMVAHGINNGLLMLLLMLALGD
jgi:membrane protease YdiL (CAAX protease family)